MQQVLATPYEPLIDVPLSTTTSVSKVNAQSNPAQADSLAVSILSANYDKGQTSRVQPYKSTYLAGAISTAAVVASFAELVLRSRKIVDSREEDSFNIAVRSVGYTFSLVICNIALGGLYRQKSAFFRTLSCIAGIAAVVLAINADYAGFKVGGPLTATAAIVWTFKAVKPIELIHSCCKKIFGKLKGSAAAQGTGWTGSGTHRRPHN